MSSDYQQWLEATIQYLENLKAAGTKFVFVSPQTLAALSRPVARPHPASAPAISRSVAGPAPTPESSRPRPSRTPAVASPAPSPANLPWPVSVPGAVPAASASALPPGPKAATLEELKQAVLTCERCPHLVRARRNVVFGVGNPKAELMFVGEAPGMEEDEQGEPFVGAAGQLLTRIIQTMGLSRETVYIANILKCRPDTPGQTSGNRKPTPAEMQNCLPYLRRQIEIIRPKVLVALGATAVEGLVGKTAGITKIRGQWHSYMDIPLMPTYHPAYLLRNQSQFVKRQVWEDMLQVMEKLGLPISAKQRGYFKSKD